MQEVNCSVYCGLFLLLLLCVVVAVANFFLHHFRVTPLSFPFLFCPNSKRTESIPKYTQKKQWMNVQTELTSYSYNLREAMLRLADYSSNKDAAKSAAQAYFVDINDIFVATKGKDGAKVDAIYSKSLDDLKAFKASLQ